jgi:hypothetical protein
MAYAFSPFHIAQAAYHPHIAQTQWVPLYLLALWRCLDAASPLAVGLLAVATAGVTFSNFYAGLIVAVVTPVALVAYWLAVPRPLVPSGFSWTVRALKPPLAAPRGETRSIRRLAITTGSLLVIAACGIWYISAVVVDRSAFAFPRADLFRYSAKWWAYLLPPVAHPLLGATVQRVWDRVDIREGLLEQQVSLGWSIVALALLAVFQWLRRGRTWTPSLAAVPVLAVVAVTALVCSLSPERSVGTFTFVRPSALLYAIAPMFRSYARFGVVVQLMAVLLAGIGLDCLRRAATRRAQVICLALVAAAAGEYVVWPSSVWRDVLPTSAHRWVVQQGERMRVLDCTPFDQESESVQWLTASRVTVLGGAIGDCAEPDLAPRLAANDYTHLLVRRESPDGQWFAARPTHGLRAAASFHDAQLFEVTAPPPAIHTAMTTGFFPRERNAEWTWQWMAADASWTVVNTTERPIAATLDIELSAFHHARQLELRLDGRVLPKVVVDPPRRHYRIGPLTIGPGSHMLVFHPAEGPTPVKAVANGNDPRALSFAVGTWTWIVPGEHP